MIFIIFSIKNQCFIQNTRFCYIWIMPCPPCSLDRPHLRGLVPHNHQNTTETNDFLIKRSSARARISIDQPSRRSLQLNEYDALRPRCTISLPKFPTRSFPYCLHENAIISKPPCRQQRSCVSTCCMEILLARVSDRLQVPFRASPR